MLSGLISGPQQPGNDIDTCFRPFVEDMKVLWCNHRVEVWDEHKCEYERINGIVKSFIRNRAYPEGSMVQGYSIEEVVEWALNYANPSHSDWCSQVSS
jgi:hypothetical protein